MGSPQKPKPIFILWSQCLAIQASLQIDTPDMCNANVVKECCMKEIIGEIDDNVKDDLDRDGEEDSKLCGMTVY